MTNPSPQPRVVGTECYSLRRHDQERRYAELIKRQRDLRWPAPRTVHTGSSAIALDLPASTRDVEVAIERSRRILDLKHGWDDEDALPCIDAWHRAIAFLRCQAEWAARHFSLALPAPEIMPLASGSVDLHWDTEEYELLINVPGDPKQPATFYGDDRGSQHVKGALVPEAADEGLLQWITRRLSRNGRKSTSLTQIVSTSEYIGNT